MNRAIIIIGSLLFVVAVLCLIELSRIRAKFNLSARMDLQESLLQSTIEKMKVMQKQNSKVLCEWDREKKARLK